MHSATITVNSESLLITGSFIYGITFVVYFTWFHSQSYHRLCQLGELYRQGYLHSTPSQKLVKQLLRALILLLPRKTCTETQITLVLFAVIVLVHWRDPRGSQHCMEWMQIKKGFLGLSILFAYIWKTFSETLKTLARFQASLNQNVS